MIWLKTLLVVNILVAAALFFVVAYVGVSVEQLHDRLKAMRRDGSDHTDIGG